MGAISQPSFPRRHPSDIRGMTWPSEGDDVMYEDAWQHKVKVFRQVLCTGKVVDLGEAGQG